MGIQIDKLRETVPPIYETRAQTPENQFASFARWFCSIHGWPVYKLSEELGRHYTSVYRAFQVGDVPTGLIFDFWTVMLQSFGRHLVRLADVHLEDLHDMTRLVAGEGDQVWYRKVTALKSFLVKRYEEQASAEPEEVDPEPESNDSEEA